VASPRELALRIAAAKVVMSASCGVEVSRIVEYRPILDRAIGLCSHNHGAASSCGTRGHLPP
jgi:propionyl-CoA synthetase